MKEYFERVIFGWRGLGVLFSLDDNWNFSEIKHLFEEGKEMS